MNDFKDDTCSPEKFSTISEEISTLDTSVSNISKVSHTSSSSSQSTEQQSVSNENYHPTSPIPEVLQLECSSVQYITNAAQHITLAAECESDKKYEEAFNQYKMAISCLLTGVKGNILQLF